MPEEEAKLLGVMEMLEIKDLLEKYNYWKQIKDQSDSFTEANGVFHIKDGLLYRQFTNDTPGKERILSLALVVPKC